ncbi:MAG TPA: hypothetical protein VLA10_05280, partial [Ilumatobacter sp.]|nr:hypothetical protein [Ilumatobacter sp.]
DDEQDEQDDEQDDDPFGETDDEQDDDPFGETDDEPSANLEDDTEELLMPDDAGGPFADVQELAEAIDQGEAEQIPTLDLSMAATDDDDQPTNDSAEDLPKRSGIWLSD